MNRQAIKNYLVLRLNPNKQSLHSIALHHVIKTSSSTHHIWDRTSLSRRRSTSSSYDKDTSFCNWTQDTDSTSDNTDSGSNPSRHHHHCNTQPSSLDSSSISRTSARAPHDAPISSPHRRRAPRTSSPAAAPGQYCLSLLPLSSLFLFFRPSWLGSAGMRSRRVARSH